MGARDDLAKKLRDEGDRAAATWVKGLRKPTVAAWLVNRLVRTERERTAALMEAGERLREAQEGLAQGTADARRLREAGEEERRAVSDLAEAARDLAEERVSPTVRERVGDTLHASTLDEEVRRQVEAARVTHDAAAVGFGGLTSGSPAARPARKASAPRRASANDEEGLRERERAAREELSRLEARADREKEALSDARDAVRRTKRERDRLQRRLEREQGKVGDVDSRVERLDREVKEARRRMAELRKGSGG